MVSHFNSSDQHAADREHLNKLIKAFVEQHRDSAVSMRLTANDRRRVMEERGITKPAGVAYSEVPLVRVPARMNQAVERVGNKLVRALHCKHSGRIVPLGAFIQVNWWSNLQIATGKFPRGLVDIVPGQAQLKRDKIDLGDQFTYRFAVSDDGALGAYLASFRTALAVMGLVCFDASLVEHPDEAMERTQKVLEGEE